MSPQRKTEDQPLERLLVLLDAEVATKLAAEELAENKRQTIARLAAEARNKGATMPELRKHVLKLEKNGETKSLDVVSVFEAVGKHAAGKIDAYITKNSAAAIAAQ